MGRGRKSKYDTHVKPYLSEITEWCNTLNEAQICQRLGVSVSVFNEYKKKYPELTECLKKGRQNLVADLKSVLIKKAKGFQYKERKVIRDSTGYEKIETYERSALPDVAAINLLLKNYDKDNWSNDPAVMRLREKELELREKQVNSQLWE